MKKIIIFALCNLTLVNLGFGQKKEHFRSSKFDGNIAKMLKIDKKASVPDPPSPRPLPMGAPAPAYTNKIQLAAAGALIKKYNESNNRVKSFGFHIPAKNLDYFISDAVGTDGIKYVQFFIGQETIEPGGEEPAQHSLYLLIAGVSGTTRGHIYIGNSLANRHMLKCNSFMALQQFESPIDGSGLATNSDNRIPIELTAETQPATSAGNLFSAVDVKTMISNYNSNDPKNMTASSFLYDASELQGYISKILNNDPNGNLQLYLGEDNKKLALILVGATGNNATHMYFNDSFLGHCALEHCIPCPNCYNINDAGLKY